MKVEISDSECSIIIDLLTGHRDKLAAWSEGASERLAPVYAGAIDQHTSTINRLQEAYDKASERAAIDD